MELERLFMLCGVSSEGQIAASWSAICERCVMLDGAATVHTYRMMAELAPQLRECGVGDDCTLVAHHDGIEVRHGKGVDLRRLAFLPWRTRVEYREASEPGYCWH